MNKKPLPPELLAARPGLADDPHAEHPVNGPMIGSPPAKYTIAVHEAIIAHIKAGNRPIAAAAAAGITSNTFYDWMKRGRSGDPHLVQFYEDVEIAQGVAETTALAAVKPMNTMDGENAKWWLERARAAGYSKEVNARVEAALSEFVEKLRNGLPHEVYMMVLAAASGQAIESAPNTFQLTAKPEDDE